MHCTISLKHSVIFAIPTHSRYFTHLFSQLNRRPFHSSPDLGRGYHGRPFLYDLLVPPLNRTVSPVQRDCLRTDQTVVTYIIRRRPRPRAHSYTRKMTQSFSFCRRRGTGSRSVQGFDDPKFSATHPSYILFYLDRQIFRVVESVDEPGVKLANTCDQPRSENASNPPPPF